MRQSLNVLVFGSGAREHAIATAVYNSPLLNKLYLANGGLFKIGEEIEFADYEGLALNSIEKHIDLAIIGPEDPICDGIFDIFKAYGIKCIAVDKHFSQLESSKLFGKEFMKKHGIKTAEYMVLNADTVLRTIPLDKFPVVLKANGLCKGKGTRVVFDQSDALKTIVAYLNGMFGECSKTIIFEEYLEGAELSLMSLWDGKDLLNFVPSRDFKKLDDSHDAPNTGGMGSYCPVLLTAEQQEKLEKYQIQLKNALEAEKADFTGFIYSGLIWVKGDWYVLEYNVRLGDPETQAILTHLKSDFLEVLNDTANQNLSKWTEKGLEYRENYSACLVIASEGYPSEPKTGSMISYLNDSSIKIYNAGVEERNGRLYSIGGRVLSLCTKGDKPFLKLKTFAENIQMQNKYYRKDIEIS